MGDAIWELTESASNKTELISDLAEYIAGFQRCSDVTRLQSTPYLKLVGICTREPHLPISVSEIPKMTAR